MQVKNVVVSCLLSLLAVSNAYAKDNSCMALIGEKGVQMLVQQCIHVSPADHPRCNASNRCYMISEEIVQGCSMLDNDGKKPKYCYFKESIGKKQATLSGVLISGGGMDNKGIGVLTEDGSRVWGYCDINSCSDDLFIPEGEEGTTLNPSLFDKKITVTFANEPNNFRVAGPAGNEVVLFVKKIQFIK